MSDSTEKTEAPFGLYAQIYDVLHQGKDYRVEADFIVDLIRRFKPTFSARSHVVDLACGTGRHALELARMGFTVTGSDLSEEMIGIARQSAAGQDASIRFHVESLQTCDRIGGSYDAAIAMFSSLGYLTTDEDLNACLAAVRTLLAPEGLFVFDVWNGLAVLRDYAAVRVRRASGADIEVVRISRTSLDEIRQLATVLFECLVLHKGKPPAEFSEKHVVRFFFPREMGEVLAANGFRVLLQCPFLDPSRTLEPTDWNATFVAQKA